MITRDEAQILMLHDVACVERETVPISQAEGRVSARPVTARISQPPAPMSAMDGYALRHSEAHEGEVLDVVGDAPAGAPFLGDVGPGEAVRVFTGSVVPAGADHVVIQEDVALYDGEIHITAPQPSPCNIRRAGIDFTQGDVLIEAGRRLGPAELAVAAAANYAELEVRRRPRVALLANGDELRPPGSDLAVGDIVCSTPFGLAPLIRAWGGEPIDLGVAEDSVASIHEHLERAGDVDIIIPLGGASVGDHDHMRAAFLEKGLELLIEKVAVKPGKPTWYGRFEETRVLGLPGNPASGLVCAYLFLKPLLYVLTGRSVQAAAPIRVARLASPIEANGRRETFLRAHLDYAEDGSLWVEPAGNQDSSLLVPFLSANALIQRAPGAELLDEGEPVACWAFP